MIEAGRVVAVVLAAGASSRFGGQKLLAPFGGRPLLQSVLDTVAGVGFGEVIVVLGRDAERIEASIQWRAERIVRNPDPGRGLSSSLQVGLGALGPGWDAALIALGDQPTVRLEVIERLLGALEPGGRPVVAPVYADGVRGNPVLVHRSAWSLADEATGDRGLGPVLLGHPELVREVDVVGVNPDVDTAADLADLAAHADRGTGGRPGG